MNTKENRSFLRTGCIALLALLIVAAGVNHFVSPGVYMKIMPEYLPWPLALIYVLGFFEVLGGVGLAVPRLRRAAEWGLIALLVAVFPANVDMLTNADQFPAIPYWALVGLPLQGVLIAWGWWAAVRGRDVVNAATSLRAPSPLHLHNVYADS